MYDCKEGIQIQIYCLLENTFKKRFFSTNHWFFRVCSKQQLCPQLKEFQLSKTRKTALTLLDRELVEELVNLS